MNNSFEIYSFENELEWKRSLITVFSKVIEDKLKSKDEVNIAISGGLTPIPFYKYLHDNWHNNEQQLKRLNRVNIFWVDERSVSIKHKESNAGNFIKVIKALPFNLYVVNGDAEDEKSEAIRYEKIIKTKISNANFDLIILGIGKDGHIASLFPNTLGLTNKNDFFITNSINENLNIRFTFTYKLLNKSDKIWFLISGKMKMKLIENFSFKNYLDYPFEKLFLENKNKIEVFYLNRDL